MMTSGTTQALQKNIVQTQAKVEESKQSQKAHGKQGKKENAS